MPSGDNIQSNQNNPRRRHYISSAQRRIAQRIARREAAGLNRGIYRNYFGGAAIIHHRADDYEEELIELNNDDHIDDEEN